MGFWDSLRSFAGNVWSGIKNTASNVWNKVSPIIKMIPLGNRFAQGVEAGASALNQGVEALSNLSRGNYQQAGENIREAYNKGKEGVEKLSLRAGGLVKKMFQRTK